MIQVVSTFLAIALLAFITKDRIMMFAAILLAVLAAVDSKPVITLLQKNTFQIGIFFLMLFILLPIANQKTSLANMAGQLVSIEGALAIIAGLGISFIGGKGVGVLASHPTVLMGVIIGTLIAVLFFEGLPAGLIIAAGLIGIFHQATA